jgi:hypothetical protein
MCQVVRKLFILFAFHRISVLWECPPVSRGYCWTPISPRRWRWARQVMPSTFHIYCQLNHQLILNTDIVLQTKIIANECIDNVLNLFRICVNIFRENMQSLFTQQPYNQSYNQQSRPPLTTYQFFQGLGIIPSPTSQNRPMVNLLH